MKSNPETAIVSTPAGEAEAALVRFKNQIINVLPAGTVYLETFLKLADIQWSERLTSAGITCEDAPRLLVNRGCVEKYCRIDDDVLVLVMHELYHVLYGHHTLFMNAGVAHNIAFDAVINARLCRSWRSSRSARFFRRVYPKPGFPEILLCPPPEWPQTASPDALAKEEVRLAAELEPELLRETLDLRNRLYGGENTVSYEDILRLLRKKAPETKPVLLGTHHSPGDPECPERQIEATSDPLLVDTARQMNEHLEQLDGSRKAGGNMGLHDINPPDRHPRRTFLRALRAVLMKAGVYQQRGSRYRQRAMADILRQSMSILPEWRDRTVAAKEILLDTTPLLYTREVPARARLWMPARQAHIYLDFSGSMWDDLPWIIGALAPLEKAGLCRIFLFSTQVYDGPKNGISSKALKTTGGTEIECVLRHILEVPPKKRPRQAVVLTDGYFCMPGTGLMTEFKESRVLLHGAITHTGSMAPMDHIAEYAVKLPDYH